MHTSRLRLPGVHLDQLDRVREDTVKHPATYPDLEIALDCPQLPRPVPVGDRQHADPEATLEPLFVKRLDLCISPHYSSPRDWAPHYSLFR
jgi:hypothetical protein